LIGVLVIVDKMVRRYSMYKYSAKVEVVDTVDMCTDFIFQVVLKEDIQFKINDCHFIVKKNHDYTYEESDYLQVAYYLQN